MGGVSRPDPWGIGQGVGAVGAVGSPAEVPQAPPRPEEAQAQATERGEGQACRHREDSKSPSYVHKLTHPRGWCAYLTEGHGLAQKPAFVGMSKGGVNAYDWAV